MSPKHSVEQISKALVETDPMITCCKENSCFDTDRLQPVLEVSGGGVRMIDSGGTRCANS